MYEPVLMLLPVWLVAIVGAGSSLADDHRTSSSSPPQSTASGAAVADDDGRRLLTQDAFDPWLQRYRSFPEPLRAQMVDEARRMFAFGYENYLRHAWPLDELDPIHCVGRGPDVAHPHNVNINDVLGDFSLSLVDSLTTLVVMGNVSEFRRAVRLVVDTVTFAKDVTVQVFEATIRVIGALLSVHLIITDKSQLLGDFSIAGYDNELLSMAHDLASRLLPAFENTKTGIPHPRVNLLYGVPCDTVNETCTAGAGSLLIEFGVLSRLLDKPAFEQLARRTNRAIWRSRAADTGLLGNVIDIQTGEWVGLLSGLGAGLDSFFEYLLKAYILFGDLDDYRMFNESYTAIKAHLRRGRPYCNVGTGDHPMYVNVHMNDGTIANTWIDSLQASFAGVQVLIGDLEEAICQHALYYTVWKKYGFLPERFNWHLKAPDVAFYPLRPEFVETTYNLYLATKNPFYLHVGKDIIESLNKFAKAKCGYATIHNVLDKSLEDRMESFFLSETCKYLYLLFDVDNPLNKKAENFIFTTEGHIFPVVAALRKPKWETELAKSPSPSTPSRRGAAAAVHPILRNGLLRDDVQDGRCSSIGYELSKRDVDTSSTIASGGNRRNVSLGCQSLPLSRRFTLPIRSLYLEQLYDQLGLPVDLAVSSPFRYGTVEQ